jgi:hypothetical protein
VRWAGHGNEDAQWLPGREVTHLDALHEWLDSKAAQSSSIASMAHTNALRDWLNSLMDDGMLAGKPFSFSAVGESAHSGLALTPQVFSGHAFGFGYLFYVSFFSG